eukprot:2843639-Rhodomonas_salina.1
MTPPGASTPHVARRMAWGKGGKEESAQSSRRGRGGRAACRAPRSATVQPPGVTSALHSDLRRLTAENELKARSVDTRSQAAAFEQ